MRGIIGERFSVALFGESHGACVGCLVIGCPSGLGLDVEDIQSKVDLRKPFAKGIHTSRMEEDRVELLSGVFEGKTTGAPICLLVRNVDVDSGPYELFRRVPRPGHADYVARLKHGGFVDHRGGGIFSGRMTLPMVMAGAVAEKLLRTTLGVETLAYSKEIGGISMGERSLDEIRELRYSNPVRCPDPLAARAMEEAVRRAAEEGDSLGGVVEAICLNVPPGLGEPLLSELDSDLARALFSIPAVKGVEVGLGFRSARMRGSECNDGLRLIGGDVTFSSNNLGGIIGGISNGMPLVLRVAFRPTPSIAKTQRSVDVVEKREVEVSVGGRHDPCVVPRAVPAVEAMISIVLADHALRAGAIPQVLERAKT